MEMVDAVVVIGNYIYNQLGIGYKPGLTVLTDNIGGIYRLDVGRKQWPVCIKVDSELSALVDAYNYLLYGKARKLNGTD